MHRTGIIGLGIMGRRMLEHMGRHAAFEATAIWDPDPAACAAASKIAPNAIVATSAEEVIGAVDVVYLACPPAPRKTYALAAADAGRAVFLEKPLGVDADESRDLVNRLTSAGAPAAVNFTQAAGAALATISADEMGGAQGADIVVAYSKWPRAWQVEADWLRFGAEGGYTREVISHFLFFTARVLGPLKLIWAQADYPADPALCESHVAARLENADGLPVAVFGAVGGAQPDRQEMTIKGTTHSWRVAEFYQLWRSDGGPFERIDQDPPNPRAVSLRAQLDQLDLCVRGEPHLLATPEEALAVQELVEAMLAR